MQPIDRSEPRLRSVIENLQKRKEDQPNVQPLGEVSARKVERLFGQTARTPPKADPAPSRAKYKMQRLWLTPMIRGLVRTGVPLVVVMVCALYALSNEELRDKVSTSLENARTNIETRPEFQVELMKISGVSEPVREDIRKALNLQLPLNSFQLDLPLLREKVEQMDSVKSAEMFMRSGNLLEVEVVARTPVILWRKGRELELLDMQGVRSGVIMTRLDRRDLPLIAGNSAQDHIAEALEIYRVANPILSKLRGLRRMGERRWDVMLTNDQIINLPEEGAVAAMRRVMAIHSAQKILDRDVHILDMRDEKRPIIRLTDVASELYRASVSYE